MTLGMVGSLVAGANVSALPGVRTQRMRWDIATALVGAAMLSVLLFPTFAGASGYTVILTGVVFTNDRPGSRRARRERHDQSAPRPAAMKIKASQKVLGRNQKKMSQDFWVWVGKFELRPRHPAAGA